MSINDLLPVLSSLSHAERFRLVQMMLQQLAEEEGINVTAVKQNLEPSRFYGRGRSSRDAIDAYLAESRAGWEQ